MTEHNSRLVRLMAMPAPCAAQLIAADDAYLDAFARGIAWRGVAWERVDNATGVECGGWTELDGPAWAGAVLDALGSDYQRVRGMVMDAIS